MLLPPHARIDPAAEASLEALNEAIHRLWNAELQFIETQCAEAMRLQDYGRLEHLTVVVFPDGTRAVASSWPDPIR